MELIIGLLVLIQIEFILFAFITLRSRRRRIGKGPSFVDTSVLMDGRVVAAVQAGFIPNELVIPESVIAELQFLADGSDSDKRSRARHGLDIATMLREVNTTKVTILKDGKAETGVDDRLLELAKKYNGSICTIDFNLNKVAVVNEIPVLNINELAQQLRMNYLPGEKVSLKVAQKGNDSHQGVGYLSDGTMVVIEQAQGDIGKTVEVEFIRSLQTVAGRMLFAKKIGKDASSQHSNTSPKSRATKTSPKSVKPDQPKHQQTRRRSKEDSLVELANK